MVHCSYRLDMWQVNPLVVPCVEAKLCLGEACKESNKINVESVNLFPSFFWKEHAHYWQLIWGFQISDAKISWIILNQRALCLLSLQQVSVSTSLIGQAHTLPRSTAIPVPNHLRAPPVPRIRGSVEGLNQEVEKLVLIGNEEEERVSLMVSPCKYGEDYVAFFWWILWTLSWWNHLNNERRCRPKAQDFKKARHVLQKNTNMVHNMVYKMILYEISFYFCIQTPAGNQ